MKKIPLTQGKVTLIDNEDFEIASLFKWSLYTCKGIDYAATRIDGEVLLLHRLIANTPQYMETDHRNRNGLDNQKNNIRICTHQQNMMNIPSVRGKSKYKGVSWNIRKNKWQVYISYNSKNKFLGCFTKEREAAQAYNDKAIELYGEFAYLNPIREVCYQSSL